MSDGSLSQDEIDALLQGTSGSDFGGSASGSSGGISDEQKESFRSLITGTIESQRSNFSMLVSKSVAMQAPAAQVTGAAQLAGRLPDEVVELSLNFTDGVTGRHLYILSSEAAVRIAGPMMGQDDVELDDAAVNALQEAFSQISGPVVTAIGDRVGKTVLTDPPEGRIISKNELELPQGEEFVALTYRFTIEGEEQAQITEIYDASVVTAAAAQTQPAQQGGGAGQQSMFSAGGGGGQAPNPFAGFGGAPAGGGGQGPSVQSVQFPNLSQQNPSVEQGNIGLLMDVYMEMTVELGRTKKLIKEILGMGEGTIIELDKLAGEPVDILVNHKLIAKGEVVVIDENFGVRVTEIVSPMERVTNMT